MGDPLDNWSPARQVSYILDNYNPNLLWYIDGALCGVSVLAYYALHLRLGARQKFAPAKEEAQPLRATAD
jgi:hypothetical protein